MASSKESLHQPSESKTSSSVAEHSPEKASLLAYQHGALHLLAELQKEGRLIDFLEENLSQYQDDEIGSSVRSIHEGCKKVLTRLLVKEKIVDQDEESSVRVNRDYDANAMKLSGRVSDQFPLKGVLVHPGWEAKEIKLPQRPEKTRMILAPAEVEIG
jgi:hypothetical protein